MESGTGAFAVVPFFAHLALYLYYILSFPLFSSLQTHTTQQQSLRLLLLYSHSAHHQLSQSNQSRSGSGFQEYGELDGIHYLHANWHGCCTKTWWTHTPLSSFSSSFSSPSSPSSSFTHGLACDFFIFVLQKLANILVMGDGVEHGRVKIGTCNYWKSP